LLNLVDRSVVGDESGDGVLQDTGSAEAD